MFELIIYTSLAVFGGYVAVVLTYLLLTFGVTSLAPRFVMEKGHFTSGYIFLHPFLWAGCGLLGGYISASIGSPFPVITVLVLAVLVTLLIISNAGELNSRQALRSKSVLAAMAVVGILGGGYIVLR